MQQFFLWALKHNRLKPVCSYLAGRVGNRHALMPPCVNLFDVSRHARLTLLMRTGIK